MTDSSQNHDRRVSEFAALVLEVAITRALRIHVLLRGNITRNQQQLLKNLRYHYSSMATKDLQCEAKTLPAPLGKSKQSKLVEDNHTRQMKIHSTGIMPSNVFQPSSRRRRRSRVSKNSCMQRHITMTTVRNGETHSQEQLHR